MSRLVRIGNAHGFWGDRIGAAAEMLAAEPDLDFITLDFLAEVSMSILAAERSRDPQGGWPRDIVEVVRSLAPYWSGGGRCRLITNAGGLNPELCARACQEALAGAGCHDRITAYVSGDDVLNQLQRSDATGKQFDNMDTGEPIADVRDRLITANAYLGAEPIVQALGQGADIVITGRVADPSLTVAACVHHHGWSLDDWSRLAGATVAGHLIECGTQVTGGISTDWLSLPRVEEIGFPIVEVVDDGSLVVTNPRGSGGCVSEQTVKEQLVYEIGDPNEYISPDVTVSFLSLNVEFESADRVRVGGATGRAAPASYKVSATYQDGFRAEGQLTIYGDDAVQKARCAGGLVLERLRRDGVAFGESVVECLGAGACKPKQYGSAEEQQLREVVLRVAVADGLRESVERFTRELMPLITAGPPGTTGYADGRPRVHPVYRYWPCLILRDQVIPRVELLPTVDGKPGAIKKTTTKPAKSPQQARGSFAANADRPAPKSSSWSGAPAQPKLGDIASARSGDKGIHANIGLVARRPQDYERMRREATIERVAAHLGINDIGRVERFELPNLGALNFVVRGILANRLRVDAQGKALGQVLLEMTIDSRT